MRAATCLLLAASLAGGCAARKSPPPAQRPAADQAAPATQLAAPVHAANFGRLWRAIEQSLRTRGYTVDYADARAGVISRRPLVSKQAFEPWRGDTVSAAAVLESSLATVRRTVRFDVQRGAGGGYAATPHVLVERQARPEGQLTTPALYRRSFTADRRARAGDPLTFAPYWYEMGSDPALEHALAEDVRSRLEGS
jgi:hypothetical protein